MEAVVDFRMIQEGDRLLLGLSGGKDSLSLLILLLLMRERSPVRFEIGCCTVNPMYPGFDPSPLKAFLRDLGVPYHYISEPIIEMAGEHMTRDSICAWCSRMKRGILYTTARKHGYGVLVLGQHLDDCAESFVMSAFRNGLLRTMKAHYLNDEGDIRIIRPLVYSRERATREFADVMRLPIITDNCPACYTGPTERYHIKKLLGAEEASNPSLFSSLRRACRTLMTDGGARAVRHLQHQVDAELEEAAESRKRASVRGRPAAAATAAGSVAASKGRRKARMGSAAAAAAAADAGGEHSDGEGAGVGAGGSAAMRAAAAEAAAVLRLLGQGPLSQPPTATAPTGARALAAAAEGTAALAAARAGAVASAAAAAAATRAGAGDAEAAATDEPHPFSPEEGEDGDAAAGVDDTPYDESSGSSTAGGGGGKARLIVTEEGGRMRLNFIPGAAKRPAAGAGSGTGAPGSCGLSGGCTLDDDDEDE
jgi:tRNA 2-thiocytidine biosynthesis protein TtcA